MNVHNTVVILGGGPSLSALQLSLLNSFRVFVVNYNLRLVPSFPFESHYYGSSDINVVSTISPLLQRFLLSDSLQFDRFFLPQKDFGLIDPKNKITYCAQDSFRFDSGLFACSSILHAMPFSYSGVNAAFNALIMGYKYILLAGIDCDYDVLATCKKNTQSVTFNEDSARQSNEYNYWCSGYHQPGDHISPPSSTNSQYLEWVQLSKFVIQSAAFSDVQFFNICSLSPFKLFPLLDISR